MRDVSTRDFGCGVSTTDGVFHCVHEPSFLAGGNDKAVVDGERASCQLGQAGRDWTQADAVAAKGCTKKPSTKSTFLSIGFAVRKID
jgi:hypothetical protein